MGTGIQDCLGHLRTGVATNTCRALAWGIDFLSLAKKPPMSGTWGAIELGVVRLCWATVARGSAPSRWASSCSSMLGLCSTATGAAPGGTSGTSGGSTSGTLPRWLRGSPWPFSSLGLAQLHLSPPFSSSSSFFLPSAFSPGVPRKLRTQVHHPGPSYI